MKGVILAGGLGTRLDPLTRVTNKHLLPVYNKPMIYYPIELLIKAGIRDILIVTGGNSSGDFLKLLGNGEDFGINELHYAYQKGQGGIADALRLAKPFVGKDKCIVVLGDNIIDSSIKPFVNEFKKQKTGARILIKKVSDPKRFGVVSFKGKTIESIVEKPKNPPSSYAVTGVYMYDSLAFEFINKLKPSKRGELEITDVNNMYIKRRKLSFSVLKGNWTDCGTFRSLHRASLIMAKNSSEKK